MRLLTLIALLFFATRSVAQTVQTTLATYAEKYPQERAYLHFDKSAYAAGETVWYKAYLMEGIVPAQRSKTLYVDWVDAQGKVLAHNVTPIVDAVSSGQFQVPVNYTASFVHVRAYTRWMLNFDSSFLYDRNIRVAGTADRAAAKTSALAVSLQFFPEGGDAITGIKSRVAFLAADAWGQPVALKGTIQSSNGAVVTTFAAQHDGMGTFELQPEAGVLYSAKWKDSKGVVQITTLPVAKSSGISLQVDLMDSRRKFTVARSTGIPQQTLHLVGTMDENLVFQTPINLTNSLSYSGLIPTQDLPTGLLTITVFDAAWNAVAERVTFVRNNDYAFAPTLEVAHWGLNKRARNELELTIPDSLDANLSVAVTDNAFATDSSENIFTRLLLTGHLKGYVPRPDYYFSNAGDSVQQQLDLVMLTHGWRRFKWEDVAKGKAPVVKYPRDSTYLSLSGKLYGAQPGSGAGTIVLLLKQKDSGTVIRTIPVEANGTFNDPEAIFFDTLNVHYQLQPANTFRGATAGFMENRLPPLPYQADALKRSGLYTDTTGSYLLQLLAQEQARASVLMKEKMLANVTVRSRTKTTKEVLDDKYASGLFSGGFNSYQFDLLNDPLASGSPSILTYLQGKVPGLQITPGMMGNGGSLSWRGGRPTIFLDQMQVQTDMIESISVTDIAYVKAIPPPFVGAPGGGPGGAIAIYTRKGGDVVSRGKGLSGSTITGYTPAREFYAPNYDRFDPRNEIEDLRTTLYWNPDVILTPQKRSITLRFFNNDVSKAFRVVIEGMTKDGRLAHLEQIME